MTLNKFELRFNDDINMQTTNDGLLVSGYVNKTNQWSQTLGQRKKFVERILPGAFRKALQNGNEIHFLAEHDKNKILASTRNDSLILREDDQGLHMTARISPTSWGKDYHQLITDGIIKNMSFGMAVLKDDWETLADGTHKRSISDLALFEVSAVRDPAYVQSTIAARSIEVIEDVEIPTEKAEQRELTFQEEIRIKKANLNKLKMVLDVKDPIDIERLKKAESEIRKMEATLEKQTTATTADNLENQEARMMTTTTPSNTSPKIIPTQLIREKAKKMDGKHSLIARTDIIVQSGGKLDLLLEDAENYTKNLFVGEQDEVQKDDFQATKVTIETQRIGTAMEVSQLLLEKSAIDEQEKSIETKFMNRIEDSLNRAMLTGVGNMDNLNADTSVSAITEAENIVGLEDIFELTDALNQEYQEGAAFIMHKNMLRNLRKNKDITADYLKREVDEVTGKKIYHLDGYPILVNNNADETRIIFGNLKAGYKTLISEGLKRITQDIQGRQISKEIRSFDLLYTTDQNRQMKGLPVYVMDAYVGGKVTNKDCFVRLDVKQVTSASESDSKQVENPTDEVSKETETVEEKTTTQSKSAPVNEESPTDNVSNENETATEESVTIQSEEKSKSAVVEKSKPQPKKTKSTKQTKPKA
ncbi:HK97 family phage prohead protease [Priestia megaterium]|uniref:HK97 family phage prohead protease n=1 Tax=Priestia megaterium TaxID=1404 RepID=UPI000BA79E45|nr:HK97 family phage prohead protease [Priestia megaterium]PAK47594.1 phage major capsid protein [Priestia megaterium]